MSSMGGAGAGQGESQSGYSGGLHDAAQVQRLAAQLERLAAAVSRDEDRARALIEAVHSSSAADVERVFREAGVDSQVSIEERKIFGARVQGLGQVAADFSSSTTHEHQHTEVHIHLGPIDISVSVDKSSDTSTVHT